MFDILSLVETVEKGGREYYAIDPGIVYPAVVARVVEVLSGDVAPRELLPADFSGNPWYEAGIKETIDRARALPAEAWQLVLTPKADLPADAAKTGISQARALALAFVERYARRALAMAVGGKTVMVYIRKDERFAQ